MKMDIIKNFVLMSLLPVLTALLIGVVTLNGCGGGGGGGDDVDDSNQTDIIGMSFTETNMLEAVSMGVSPLNLFHPLSLMTGRIIDALEFPVPSGIPYDLSDEFCVGGGNSNLVWSDTDPSGISVNDIVTLNFIDCDLEGDPLDSSALNGSITFILTQYDQEATGMINPYVGVQVMISLSVEEILDDPPSTQTIEGDFLARVYRSSTDINTAIWGFRYGDRAIDPDALITLTEVGSSSYQFGCFDISVSYQPGVPFDYLLGDSNLSHIYGITTANDHLLTVTGTPPSSADLVFADENLSDGSGLVYYGLVLGDGCAALGVPDGVSLVGDAALGVYPVATSPGTVRIELYLDGFGTLSDVTSYELWDDLY